MKDDMLKYDGVDVKVTMLSYPQETEKKASDDWERFVIPSERRKNVDEYMREMRENDRFLGKSFDSN